MDSSPANVDSIDDPSKMDLCSTELDLSPVKVDLNRASSRMDSSPAKMDSNRLSPRGSPQFSEPRAAFRKPSNDTSRRNYRRHSPSTSRSLSPPSSGGWKRDRSPLSLNNDEDGKSKMADSYKRGRRSETGREPDREFESSRGEKGDGIYYDRRIEVQNRDSYRSTDYRSNEYSYGRRRSNYYDRSYHPHSNSSRASYTSTYSEYSRRDEYDRRGHRERGYDEHGRSAIREADRYHREHGKVDKDESKKVQEKIKDISKDKCKEREGSLQREKDVYSDAYYNREIGRDRRVYKDRDEKDRGRDYEQRDDRYERDRRRERDDRHGRDRHRDRHESSKDHAWYEDVPEVKEHDRHRRRENLKEHVMPKEKDEKNYFGGDKDEYNQREAAKKIDDNEEQKCLARGVRKEHSRDKVVPGGESGHSIDRSYGDYFAKEKVVAPSSSHGACRTEKDSVDKNSGKFNIPASDACKLSKDVLTDDSREVEVKAHNSDLVSPADSKFEYSKKWGPGTELATDRTCSASTVEGMNDMNVARIAAMRAAELVNKNLGAGGFLSTEQKKKLLWGSKKSVVDQPEEVASGSNRWDMARFSDPDRQEKFNKLMGVKGDLKVDQESGEKEAGLFTSQRQMEVQEDLEKQFTAGMRRRDGRTVGLGL